MTAGLPGTGIGGLFYLLSALLMPLRHAYRQLRSEPTRRGWAHVAAQTGLALGILAGMWVVGWMLGLLVSVNPSTTTVTTGPASGNALRTATLVAGVGTLALVLLAVQVLRLVLRRKSATVESETPVVVPKQRYRFRRRVMLVLISTLVSAQTAVAGSDEPVTVLLARAESAYAAGNVGLAEQEYRAVLSIDPDNSRATYRLADLLRTRDPRAALQLFRRYVELEPTDPWGYMAVGATLLRLGRPGIALKWYDAALRIAPQERDAHIGRARVLVRDKRITAAIATYEQWLTSHPADDAARRELAVLRPRAAATITPVIGGSRDSDGNGAFRIGGIVESPLWGVARLGLIADRTDLSDGVSARTLQHVALRTRVQAGAGFSFDAGLGAMFRTLRSDPVIFMPGSGSGSSPGRGGRQNGSTIAASPTAASSTAASSTAASPTAELRTRWRAAGGGARVDLRAQHGLLTGTSQLLDRSIARSELRATTELPMLPGIRLRGTGRAAVLQDSTPNYRTSAGGAVAIAVMPAVELSVGWQRVGWRRASTAGYFTPRLAQAFEAGSYTEFELGSRVSVVVDGGVGVQQSAPFGGSFGRWSRALRLYALVAVQLGPGRDLRMELETEDSPWANEAATRAGWRYAAATLSMSWGW